MNKRVKQADRNYYARFELVGKFIFNLLAVYSRLFSGELIGIEITNASSFIRDSIVESTQGKIF